MARVVDTGADGPANEAWEDLDQVLGALREDAPTNSEADQPEVAILVIPLEGGRQNPLSPMNSDIEVLNPRRLEQADSEALRRVLDAGFGQSVNDDQESIKPTCVLFGVVSDTNHRERSPSDVAHPWAANGRDAGSAGKAQYDFLTVREQQILTLVAQGNTNKEIAESINIAISTVKTHMHNIMRKVGATTRIKAVVNAFNASQQRSTGAKPGQKGQQAHSLGNMALAKAVEAPVDLNGDNTPNKPAKHSA